MTEEVIFNHHRLQFFVSIPYSTSTGCYLVRFHPENCGHSQTMGVLISNKKTSLDIYRNKAPLSYFVLYLVAGLKKGDVF